MPTSRRETVVCRYHYDPLDRLIDCTPIEQPDIQRFYNKSRLATEIQGAVQTSIFQHDDQLLAQRQSQSGKIDTTLMATDQQRSVLCVLDATQPHPLGYTAYGHRPAENGLLSLLGFNGERPDPVTGHYHLGNGYRQFNPVLMRFNSPDSWSPFGEGGLNAYAYCVGDPVNWKDSTGHSPVTPKIDTFLKKMATDLFKTLKPISKPLAASGDETARTLSSSSRVSSREQRKLLKKHSSREYMARLKKLSDTIKKNEAELGIQNQYSISEEITGLNNVAEAFEKAKVGYHFEIYPNPEIPYFFQGPEGNPVLDNTHFDVAKLFYKKKALSKETASKNYASVQRVEILRAKYIKQHTGIDLMSVRQQS